MGQYSKSLSSRLRNGYSYKPFHKVTPNDLFCAAARNSKQDDLIDFFDYFKDKEHYSNGTYYAIVDKVCDSKHFVSADHFGHRIWYLRIGRIDREPIHNWSTLQTIKNEIVGAEYEAVELYAAQPRLMNNENVYHLWISAPGETETKPPRFSIGYKWEGGTKHLIRKTQFEKMSLRARKEVSENKTVVLVPEEVIAAAEQEFPEIPGMIAAYHYVNAHPEIGSSLETWNSYDQ